MPVSGGGLISGISTVLKSFYPKINILGIEPEGYDDTAKSIKAKKRIKINDLSTKSLCDSLLAPTPGKLTFSIIKELVNNCVTVTDKDIKDAMKLILNELKLIVEPGGAAGLAALINGKVKARGKNIVIIISGSNVSPDLIKTII